ncbi:hypothetical protein H6P81_010937 [Aristolochia fimbriata]|uniref:Uncharacterized protein n=1 Tax=Aristolochia fimbriata TaxID=158543 RepID=A0AAV7ETK6_ARIFI|nr:hypothetical protein H6P81_010937 [Aristolochia fimbriata]
MMKTANISLVLTKSDGTLGQKAMLGDQNEGISLLIQVDGLRGSLQKRSPFVRLWETAFQYATKKHIKFQFLLPGSVSRQGGDCPFGRALVEVYAYLQHQLLLLEKYIQLDSKGSLVEHHNPGTGYSSAFISLPLSIKCESITSAFSSTLGELVGVTDVQTKEVKKSTPANSMVKVGDVLAESVWLVF